MSAAASSCFSRPAQRRSRKNVRRSSTSSWGALPARIGPSPTTVKPSQGRHCDLPGTTLKWLGTAWEGTPASPNAIYSLTRAFRRTGVVWSRQLRWCCRFAVRFAAKRRRTREYRGTTQHTRFSLLNSRSLTRATWEQARTRPVPSSQRLRLPGFDFHFKLLSSVSRGIDDDARHNEQAWLLSVAISVATRGQTMAFPGIDWALDQTSLVQQAVSGGVWQA